MKFGEPKESDLNDLKLSHFNSDLGLWMSIVQISRNPGVLQEPLKSQLGDSADKHSLFTCIWMPRLYFKQKPYDIISIKVKYRLTDEGVFGSADEIVPLKKTSLKHNSSIIISIAIHDSYINSKKSSTMRLRLK